MLIIAVVAVATGAFGPIYLHSADQAVLNGAIGSAPPGSVGLTLQPGAGDGSVRLMDAADRVPRAGGGRTWFGEAYPPMRPASPQSQTERNTPQT
jgi:hypothetical protein